MSAVDIRPVDPAVTRPLRRAILRPHQTLAEMVYPGDDAPTTAHFAAFRDGRVVGSASIYLEPPPERFLPGLPAGADPAHAWRLRAMAVAEDLRGRGVGAALLAACVDHARSHGATSLWCNARTPAVEFYRRLGLAAYGEQFEEPGIGPHYFMAKALTTRGGRSD